MTAQSAQKPDPFDLDFEADDDFAPVQSAQPAAPHEEPDALHAAPEPPDPFAGLSPTESTPDPFAGLVGGGGTDADDDAFDHGAGATAANPIADMLASAEAALGEHTV